MDQAAMMPNQHKVSPDVMPSPTENDHLRGGGVLRAAGNTALGLIVAAEINPLTNEAPRIMAAAATQAITHSPEAATAVYAASTFIVEAGGAYAAAKLLNTEGGRWITTRFQQMLGKLGISQLVHTNYAIDSGIAMVAGTPAVLAIKQQQNPERTTKENIRYGTALALGTTAVSAVIGYLGTEGIAHPSPLWIGCAVAGVGALIAVRRWIADRLTKKNSLDYDSYMSMVQDDGPQLRGYQPADYNDVIHNKNTSFVSIPSKGKTRLWPLLADIGLNSEYVQDYFIDRYGEDAPTLYLSLPPRHFIEESPRLALTIAKKIYDASLKGSKIVIDELTGSDDTVQFVQSLIKSYRPYTSIEIDNFTDERNDTPAKAVHFYGRVKGKGDRAESASSLEGIVPSMRQEFYDEVAKGEVDLSQHRRAVILDPDSLDLPINEGQTALERMIEIYQDRFTELVSGLPVRGAQTPEELENLLRSPSTLIVAQMDGNQIVAFTYISDVKDCEWLNADYYEKQHPDEMKLYFPGIAADKHFEGRTSMQMIHLICRLAGRAYENVSIIFQCTNISEEYIPRLVKLAINSEPNHITKLDGDIQQSSTYRYYGLQIHPQSRSLARAA